MTALLASLPLSTADRMPDRVALRQQAEATTYAELAQAIDAAASGLRAAGLDRQDRVAIYLNKRIETVVACFGTSHAGGVFVPVNPLLKSAQVGHILRDSGATALVTSPDRLVDLAAEISQSQTIRMIVTTAGDAAGDTAGPRLPAGHPNAHLGGAARFGVATPGARHRSRRCRDPVHVGEYGSAEGCRAVPSQPGLRRAQRRRVPRKHAGRPVARSTAVQLRLRLQPTHDRVPGRRERLADRSPVREGRRHRRAEGPHHGPRRGAAVVDTARRSRVAAREPTRICATSRIPADECRAPRSPGCGQPCRGHGHS